MINKIMVGFMVFAAVLTFSACTGDPNDESVQEGTEKSTDDWKETDNGVHTMAHSRMNHAGSGEVPKELQPAKNPTFPIGSKVIIQSGHMEGMKGAEATISGAYNTTAYTVSYTPTTGGDPVINHKWVIHEELDGTDKSPLKPGTVVTIRADHMEGMKGSTGTIESAEKTTVYMVNFTSATGEQVTNHKWVTESELSAVE